MTKVMTQKLEQISLLDRAYRAATNNELFFNNGCGDYEYLQELIDIYNAIASLKKIELKWQDSKTLLGIEMANGTFVSSAHKFLPSESKIAYVRKIMPVGANKDTPVVVHFPGTGDEGFKRREFFLAVPLAKKGIGSIILEAPYYGYRRPHQQNGMYIREASDLFKMVHSMFEEGRSILDYLQRQGFEKVVTTGFSMGGVLSVMTAFQHNLVSGTVPCVTPHAPHPVFLEQTLKDAINWDAMKKTLPKEFTSPQDYLTRYFDLSDMQTFPRFRVPKEVEIVAATHDAYVPKASGEILARELNAREVTWVDGGHVSALVLYSNIVRNKIQQVCERI